MASRLNPYLSFRDNAREAMEFYQGVFGGKLGMTTFKEFDVFTDAAEGDKIMHGMLEAPNGMVLMGAETMPMAKAPWGDSFGMLKDRFGVDWLVNISGQNGQGGPGRQG